MMKDIFELDIFGESGESLDTDTVIYEESADDKKPAGTEHGVTIPGGNSETPSAKPYDASSVAVPAKTTITADQYNSALANLKKSFKEAADVVEALENASVITKTPEELQMEFTESYLENALLESYEDGPIFEAVDQSDKDAVKDIVRKLRPKVEKSLRSNNVEFYKPNLVARCIISPLTAGAATALATGAAAAVGGPLAANVTGAVIQSVGSLNSAAGFKQILSNRLWQVLGVVHASHGDNLDIAKRLTEEFKDELGDYKILTAKAIPAIYDLFKTKFGWKNNLEAYFLIVDKKLPAELKEFQKEVEAAVKENKDDKKDDSKSKKD